MCTPFNHILLKAAKVTSTRRGSRINTDRFPKRAPKEQASRWVRGHAPLGNLFWIVTPQSPDSCVSQSLRQDIDWRSKPFSSFQLRNFFPNKKYDYYEKSDISLKRWEPVWIRAWSTIRAVNPPRLQILRIEREGILDDVMMHGTWRHFQKKLDVAEIVKFDLIHWCTSHQSHFTMAYRSLWGNIRS